MSCTTELQRTADCIVVGGGVSGLMTARELAAAGLSVTVLERGASTGREASWAGGGILSPLYPWRYPHALTALVHWSQARFPRLAAALTEETGIDPEWTPSGMVYLGGTETEAALAWAASVGQTVEPLTPPQALELEPALAHPGTCALWMPEIAQIRNPRLLRALRAAVVRAGVSVLEDTEVLGLAVSAGRVRGVRSSRGRFEAPRVVVAGGAWTGGLLAGLPHAPAVGPVRGQMIVFHAEPDLLKRIVMKGAHYLIPRRDGRILCGSTLEFVGFDKSTTEAARAELHAAAIALVPALRAVPIEHHWAGLRPGSPGEVPYIGAHPELEGLYVNAGHYRYGLTMGPASARLLAELMLGHPPSIDPAPYALDAERGAEAPAG